MSAKKHSMKNYGKFVVPGLVVGVIVTLTTMNACTPGDHSTEGREEVMNQNAADAEAEDAKLANADQPKADKKAKESGDAKAAPATAKVASNAKATKPDGKTDVKKDSSAAAKTAVAATTAHKARRPASAGGVYVVQVGAFKIKENAEKLQAKLKTAGYTVETHTIEHSKNGLLHLVQFAPTSNRAEAETVIEQLQASQDLRAQILAVPETH